MIVPLMGKDPRWLQVEVCREFQRGKCSRTEDECRFAHPPAHVAIHNGRVTACFDSLKERCQREKCKYLHPPKHLKTQLETNGRMLQHQQMAMQQQLMQQQMVASNPALLQTWPVTVPTSNGTLIQQPVAFLSDPSGLTATPRRLDKSDKLEVCREYQRGACSRDESECRYAHPPRHTTIDTSDGMVTVCMDFIKGKCQRETCKYFHPPTHLQGRVKAAQQQQMSLPMLEGSRKRVHEAISELSPGEPLRKQATTVEVPIIMSGFTAPQFPQGLATMQFPSLPVPLVAGLQMFPQQTQWTPQSGNFIPMEMATPPPTPQNMSPSQPQTTFIQAPAPTQPQYEPYDPYQYQAINNPQGGQAPADMQYCNGYYYSVMPATNYSTPNGY